MTYNIVDHYGIHYDASRIGWLMQGRGSTNAVGRRERPPFTVRLPNNQRHCNHQIPLAAPIPHDNHWGYFQSIIDDPLVWAMLPIPKQDGGLFTVSDPNDDLHIPTLCLSKTSSPIFPCVVPAAGLTIQAVIKEMQQTNLQPYVIYDMDDAEPDLVSAIAKIGPNLPRKVVMIYRSGKSALRSSFTPITNSMFFDENSYDLDDLISIPWESIGATLIRRFMRKEPIKVDNPKSGGERM